jgi:MFS transporter, NNP family, nitrate/nitrite transporter
MFIPEVAGTALSLVAGWGNLGGGVAQVVVGSLLFPLFKVIYGGEGYGQAKTVYVDDDDIEYEFDKASDRAWRTVMVIPGLMVLAMSFYALKCTDDSPKVCFMSFPMVPFLNAKMLILTSLCSAVQREIFESEKNKD